MSRARKWITSSFPGEEIKSQIERILSSSDPVKELEGQGFSVLPGASYMVAEKRYTSDTTLKERMYDIDPPRYVIFCTSDGNPIKAIRLLSLDHEYLDDLSKMLDSRAPDPEIFSYRRFYWFRSSLTLFPGWMKNSVYEPGQCLTGRHRLIGRREPYPRGYYVMFYDRHGNECGWRMTGEIKDRPLKDYPGLLEAVEKKPDYSLESVRRRHKLKRRLQDYSEGILLLLGYTIGLIVSIAMIIGVVYISCWVIHFVVSALYPYLSLYQTENRSVFRNLSRSFSSRAGVRHDR